MQSVFMILPTHGSLPYRGKYPTRARSVSCGATGLHVELNNGLRLWSYGAKLRELPRVGHDFAQALESAAAMSAEQYAALCEAAELSRKAPEGATNVARTIARAEKAAAIRDKLESILAPAPAAPETLAERAGINVRPVMSDNGPAFEAAPVLIAETARARYWRTQAGFVSTLPGAELTADTGAGYARLDALMRLKGESAETIDSTLRAEVLRLEQAGRVRRDNVEYHAGRAAFEAGQVPAAMPYSEGGERAARWNLGYREAQADAAPVETGQTIDMTPTWAGMLPAMRALIENGSAEGRRVAWAELEKAARLADERNHMARSFAELREILADWPTLRALSAHGAEVATGKKRAARAIVARHIGETISKESGK